MRSMRLAALTVAMTLAFSGLALARDHDDDRHRDDHYRNDHYKDRHDERHHDWDRGQTTAGGIATGIMIAGEKASANEFESTSAGSVSIATTATTAARFTTAYPRGYPSGGYGYPGGSNGYPGTVYGRGGYGNAGGIGLQPGPCRRSNQARKDMAQGKPFNPNPRGLTTTLTMAITVIWGTRISIGRLYTEGYRSWL